jgi:hypothetical protein
VSGSPAVFAALAQNPIDLLDADRPMSSEIPASKPWMIESAVEMAPSDSTSGQPLLQRTGRR